MGVPFSVLVVIPGGLPECSHRSKLGNMYGVGLFRPLRMSGDFCSTIVLEGIVLCRTGLA